LLFNGRAAAGDEVTNKTFIMALVSVVTTTGRHNVYINELALKKE
jgi:hypothetical protein